MPEFIIESLSASKYFKFDDAREVATTCSMSEATGFPTEEIALQTLKDVAQRLADKAKTGIPSSKWAQCALELELSKMKSRFTVSSRPTLTDLVGVFGAYYVRSSGGWLSRPHLRAHDGRLWWSEAFTFAAPFPDLDSATRALSDNSHWGVQGGSIVKASCVFTEVVVTPVNAKIPDDVRGAIQSACEARDISSSLEASAKERLDAMAPQGEPEKPKRAARL